MGEFTVSSSDIRGEQVLCGFAAADEASAFAFDQHLGGAWAGVVVRGERLAVGSGIEDGDEVAGLDGGKLAVVREEVSGFADRANYVAVSLRADLRGATGMIS